MMPTTHAEGKSMAPSPPSIDDDAAAPAGGQARLLEGLRVSVLIAALGIAALGAAGGLAGLALAFLAEGGERLTGATVAVSVVALAAGLGLPLAWHAWQAVKGRPSATFLPGAPWALAAAFALAVAGGQAVLQLGLLPALLFPPFHLVAALAPPLFLVAAVACGLGGVGRWRDTALQLASGAFVATPLAFLVEGAFIAGLAGALATGLALQPGGQEMLQALAESAWLQDPANLLPLLARPAIVSAALLVTALFVPLVEELAKAVGVGLVGYKRPDARQAMLWGLAGGAGFAMVEGLLNTAGSLPAWAPVIVLRVGASLLHCTTGALMGLAWQQILVQRRWGPALGLYGASVAVHAAWNAVSVGVAFLSLGTAAPGAAAPGGPAAAVGTWGLVACLVLLTAGLALLLAALTRRLARQGGEPAPGPLPAGEG